MELYKPFPSKAKNKKMSVYVMKDGKRKLIHFGDTRYQDFTQNKGDKQKRLNYLTRTAGIKNKEGKLTKDDKNTANYWSRKVLWLA
jgi:hypothetical protein